ncbi:unnamed protein product [Prunus armeniaca]
MVVLREFGGCQPILNLPHTSYTDKDANKVVTFKFFHGELFGIAKDLGYDDGYDVSFYGEDYGTSRLIEIVSDMSQTSSQVGNDSSDIEYSCSKDEDSSDSDFEDSDYAQSDEEIDLLKKNDKRFEGYVDYTCTDNDPNAEEKDESDNGEESPTFTCPSSSSSEDEALGELRRKRNRMPKGEDFIPEIDMANPRFNVGLKFATTEMFRKAVRRYSINCGRELIFMNNDRNKIIVCEEGCPFVIHASSVSGSTYLQLSLNQNWTASSFAEQVHQDYDYRTFREIVYRARAMEVDIVERSYTCKKGFLDGCKPVVCLDGCHVKGPHSGQVLSTMGVDANNGMFPLAYAYLPRYGIPLKCGNCGGEGHNRISCKEPRNPNIKPTRKRKVAKEKLEVRRRDGKTQSTRQQSMQISQRKQSKWFPKAFSIPGISSSSSFSILKISSSSGFSNM